MEYEKLNDSEKEIALVAMNVSEIYPRYLVACHACANAAIRGTLTTEKAIRNLLPVVRLAIEWECGESVKYYDILPLASRKKVAAYLYESEKNEMIHEMEYHTATYLQSYVFVNYVHINAPGMWTFAPGKRAKFVRRWADA